MPISFLLDRFASEPDAEAVVWRQRSFSYGDLLARIELAGEFLRDEGVRSGESVLIDADFSLGSVALLLAAARHHTIVVPIASHVANIDRTAFARIAQASHRICVSDADEYAIERMNREITEPLLDTLKERRTAGLVLFSSGISGEPKAAVHDLEMLLKKFRVHRHRQRIVSFLLFDHIGGFNTLLYALSNLGCVVTLEARDPVSVCRAIETHRPEVLPTSPTFLNLLLMSGAAERFDLSSLKVISYSTEVMPEPLLRKLTAVMPQVEFRQSYGLTELGIMRSRSQANDSVWVQVGGEDYQTRVVDGVLQIKAKSSMLGYLNAPSPFTEDGWFNTQDEVEERDGWIRFLGRRSEIINVGGEKVYPAEVEAAILEVANINDVTVFGEEHPILGHIVRAEVRLDEPEDIREVRKRIRSHCFARMESFKVPVKIELAEIERMTERFKKQRRAEAGSV